MVIFRNVVNGQPLVNWWDNGNNQIAFGRGNRGYIVINNDDWWGDALLSVPLSWSWSLKLSSEFLFHFIFLMSLFISLFFLLPFWLWFWFWTTSCLTSGLWTSRWTPVCLLASTATSFLAKRKKTLVQENRLLWAETDTPTLTSVTRRRIRSSPSTLKLNCEIIQNKNHVSTKPCCYFITSWLTRSYFKCTLNSPHKEVVAWCPSSCSVST